ncbi:oligosaccharide flippase family protein [Rossellomorea sp. H39__3]
MPVSIASSSKRKRFRKGGLSLCGGLPFHDVSTEGVSYGQEDDAGTFFLTSATFISKIIGFLFIIPFTLLVGDTGYALYKYAYGPYTILLSLSTVGLPLAVSKFVAKYNERGNYLAGLNLLRYGLIAMIISGIVSFLLLYFSAPWVVVAFGEGGSGNSREDMIYVVRLVSFALLVVPPMSLLRGTSRGVIPWGHRP